MADSENPPESADAEVYFGGKNGTRLFLIMTAIVASVLTIDMVVSAIGKAPQIWISSLGIGLTAFCLTLAVKRPFVASVIFAVATLVFAPNNPTPEVLFMLGFLMIFIVSLAKTFWVALVNTAMLGVWSVAHSAIIGDELAFGQDFVFTAFIPMSIGVALRYSFHQSLALQSQYKKLFDKQEYVRAQEREALARDLHDVVGHQLTLVSLIAGSRARSDDTAQLKEALREVQLLSGEALIELRGRLRILQEQATADPCGQIRECRAGRGLQTEIQLIILRLEELNFTVVGEWQVPNFDVVHPEVQTAASRILTESATNIIKYAASNSEIRLTVALGERHLSLGIDSKINPELETDPQVIERQENPHTSGEGLLSMRERALLLGGEFHAGQVGNLWSVRCTLPVEPC